MTRVSLPSASMTAALSRRTAGGADVGGQGVSSVAQALALHTGQRHIAPGMPADLAVVEPDPFMISSGDLPRVRAVATIVAGRLVWLESNFPET